MASELGGRCLSHEFIDQMSDHSWSCKKGHTFDLSPYLVSKGAWCYQCLKKKIPEEHLQWLHNYAIERGGKCLSSEFINRKTRVKFECSQGHQWEVLPTIIMYEKTWCKKCAGLAPLTLDDIKQWAIKRGGECLSSEYLGREIKHRLRCSAGHEFEHTPRMIQRGLWCTKCNKNKETDASFKLMKNWAEERGGKLISTKYVDTLTLLEWECKNGHRFSKNRDQVKQLTASNWCRQCISTDRNLKKEVKILEEMNHFAAQKGGKCLSETYQNNHTYLRFECSKGHQWETKAHNVIYSRSWCPECNLERLRKSVIRKKT